MDGLQEFYMFSKIKSEGLLACNCANSASICALTEVMDKTFKNIDLRNGKKDINSNTNGIKKIKTIEIRKEEVLAIRNRFPTKIPIIVQRFCKETHLPHLDKSKFLVPQEITMSQFLTVIRNRMKVTSTQALYLLVNNRSMISLSLTLAEVYTEYCGPDGFLYVTYASQEVFGNSQTNTIETNLENLCGESKISFIKPNNETDTPNDFKPFEEHPKVSKPPQKKDEYEYIPRGIQKVKSLNGNESHFIACFDNTYKSMMVG